MSFRPSEENDHVAQDAASLLDLDSLKVRRRTEDNRRSNYGVALVAGHGMDRTATDIIAAWKKEVSSLTSGKINLDSVFTHCTVAKICRSKGKKKEAASSVPKAAFFNAMLKSIEVCEPFDLIFRSVRFSSKRDGNIVLIANPGNSNFHRLRIALLNAGVSFGESPLTDPKPLRAFVTLGHIDSNALKALTVKEAKSLKKWVENHFRLDKRVVYTVRELKLVIFKKRRLEETLVDDLILTLGQPSLMDGRELRSVICTHLKHREPTRTISDARIHIADLKGLLRQFRDERDWLQFHDAKNLAEAISIEAAEFLELFQWKKPNEIANLFKRKPKFKESVERELADVLCNVLNFANVMNIDVSHAVASKIEANGKKYPVSKSRGIAKNVYKS